MELKDRIAQRVIDFYVANEPSVEQIQHTLSVVAYTHLIAAGEEMERRAADLQEMAAWLHDIGCPDARRLYGNSRPVHQQAEGRRLTAEWLKDEDELTGDEKQWLADAVGCHHQGNAARTLHFEPLFEADLIVNLIEGYYAKDKARHFYDTLMTTRTGKELFAKLFL